MKTEFINQFDHSWKVLGRIVADFDDGAWTGAGRKGYSPARLGFHILRAAKYYLADPYAAPFPSGKPFDIDWVAAKAEDLPSRSDVMAGLAVWKGKTARWLSDMDFDSANTAFPWAGATQGGVALFLLRHMLYHMGELSSLLNESRNGEAADHYVEA
jgi:hypothetical protein